MFARIEVAMKPEFNDPAAEAFLRRAELAHPELRAKIRWARMMEVYWIDIPIGREDMIRAIHSVFWDRVLQWLFTGNLIPSAAGKHGGLQDLFEAAPVRPGEFWAIERRFRPGVTDNIARTVIEAFEIVLQQKLPEARAASGNLLLLEGPELNEDLLAVVARDLFCNELIQTWSLVPASELKKSDRFHQERIKRDLPRVSLRGTSAVEEIDLQGLSDTQLEELSRKKLWALSLEEMKAIRDHRAKLTDVELEIIAQTWSEHCKHKIFNAKVHYKDRTPGSRIPRLVDGLFKKTIAATTAEIEKPWLLSVFSDNAGIVAFDEEDAFCIKVETHNSPSALDPYGGALTGIVGVNRDILGCGLGAKPIFNTDVFCVAPLDYADPLPERLFHPRRILDGIRLGVEHGGNKSGIPTVNGALVFDRRYLGKPLVYCGTGGFLPRTIAGRPCQSKEVLPGDRVCMVGGRIGKDGIHGATFSSLALDESSPMSAVQLGDPITQKRMSDFLLEARDQGFYRAITDNGAGGLSSSVGELALLSGKNGGARIDVSRAQTKYPGLKPYELVVSESQERMTVVVPADKLLEFTELAARRNVDVSDLGEFTDTGFFEVLMGDQQVARLDLEFLHDGVPQLELEAVWEGRPAVPVAMPSAPAKRRSFAAEGTTTLLELLARPNIASKEWLIRQYDHEVQGTSVVKPLHTAFAGTAAAFSGPNDAAVLKPKATSEAGIVVSCGINSKLSDLDPYLMAQASVDEAVRNALCVGAEYGKPESVLALVDNFCWPDPVGDSAKTAWLVRACYGLRDACLALSIPLVSGKDSMKNDFRGKQGGNFVSISVPPTLLMTAVGRVGNIRNARTADFKNTGDVIYLLGGSKLGLVGSEFQVHCLETNQVLPGMQKTGEPDWDEARRIYSWLGGTTGKEQSRIRSLHDVSEGGLLCAVAEGLIAKGLGATIRIPDGLEPWDFGFGEGFHSFILSVAESDATAMESEWITHSVPFTKIGAVMSQERLDVTFDGATAHWSVALKQLRSAWQKERYWE